MNKSKLLMDEIGQFLGCISNSVLVFREGIKDFLYGDTSSIEKRCIQISDHERDADNYLKSIRHNLIVSQLIPDSSADILEMLDDMDNLADISKQSLLQLNIEKPQIIYQMECDILEISEASVVAVEELIKAVRAFFNDIRILDQYVKNVYFYEKKADMLEEKLKRNIFDLKGVGLSKKIQARYFVEKIALLSDEAEEIAKNLLINKIKRNI